MAYSARVLPGCGDPGSFGDLQGKAGENGQRGMCHHGVGVTLDRRTLGVANCTKSDRYRLGPSSVP